MSTTPVLTKEQQKETLSAKKKSRKKCLRNVLAKPFSCKSSHPDEGTCNTLLELLKSVIASEHKRYLTETAQVASENPKTEKGKKCRTNILKESGLRNLLFVGINAATRGLEKDEVRSLIIDKSVDPPIMISHVGDLCNRNRVPHVVVANLRNATNTAFGFPTIAIALKVCVLSYHDFPVYHHMKKGTRLPKMCSSLKIAKRDDPLLQLHDNIVNVSKEFSDGNCIETELENETVTTDSPSREERLTELPNGLTTVVDSKLQKCSLSEDELPDRKEDTCKVMPLTVEVYKYRNSIRERVFLPKKSKLEESEFFAVVSCEESSLDDEPMMGISANFPIKAKKRNISDRCQEYKPPIIKKLCPNPQKKAKK